MGCITSKSKGDVASPPGKKRVGDHKFDLSQSKSVMLRILDAIKKRDVILLEKTMKRYNLKPTDHVVPVELQRTILHAVAESNFYQGMEMLLSTIVQSDKPLQTVINVKDKPGNTPLMVCVLNNSNETAEIMLKFDVDLSVKNSVGRTALEIAKERDSSCAPLLTLNHTNKPKASSPDTAPDSVYLNSITSIAKEKVKPDKYRIYSIQQEWNDKGPFIDEEFPHDNLSITDEANQKNITSKYSNLKWTKSNEILGIETSKTRLFETFDVADVKHSPNYGCDLYSALAALTEYPSRLVKVFTLLESKVGAYSVDLLVSGVSLELVLDDFFPCDKKSPVFASSNTNELWFMLLEKAFAKLYGNYTEINTIGFADAMESLTSMPCIMRGTKDVSLDELWNLLQEYDKLNYIVNVGNPIKPLQKGGGNRILTVQGTFEVGNQRIVKLANHWDEMKWKGMFADKSKEWTSSIKDEVGYYEGETGSIYVEISELPQNFEFFTVCLIHDNWHRNTLDVKSNPKKGAFIQMQVDRELEVMISLHQKLPRFVNENIGYDISPVEVIVVDDLEQSLTKIAHGEKDSIIPKQSVYADDKVKIKLSEGKYLIRVKVRWVDGLDHEFTVNTLSSAPIQIQHLKKFRYKNFLTDVYRDSGKRVKDRYDFGRKCEFSSAMVGTNMYFYCVNHGKQTWNVEINFDKLEGLRLAKPFRVNDNTVRIVVGPESDAVAYAKRVAGTPVKISWKFNNSWS